MSTLLSTAIPIGEHDADDARQRERRIEQRQHAEDHRRR